MQLLLACGPSRSAARPLAASLGFLATHFFSTMYAVVIFREIVCPSGTFDKIQWVMS